MSRWRRERVSDERDGLLPRSHVSQMRLKRTAEGPTTARQPDVQTFSWTPRPSSKEARASDWWIRESGATVPAKAPANKGCCFFYDGIVFDKLSGELETQKRLSLLSWTAGPRRSGVTSGILGSFGRTNFSL